MADSKIHPPSASRIEEARSSGLAPRPVLVGLAGGFMALTLCALWQWPALAASLRALLRLPLAELEHGRPEQALRSVAWQGASVAIVVFACSAGALFLAQGPSFGWPGRRRARFDEPRPVRSVLLLAGVVLVVVLGSLLRDLLWATPDNLAALFTRLLLRTALALTALAVIDSAFARAAFFRALWLTRREQRDEQREAYGSPEIRATRERIRRESALGSLAEARAPAPHEGL
jgi:flagellar biosynthesis protein FlhB